MKKILSILIVISLIISNTLVFADMDASNEVLNEKELTKYATILNVEEEILSGITIGELEYLISVNAHFESVEKPSYTLYRNVKVSKLKNPLEKHNALTRLKSDDFTLETLTQEITEEEYNTYFKDKDKKSVLKDLNNNSFISSLENSNYITKSATQTETETENLDWGVLVTTLQVWDASNTTHTLKYAAYNFHWNNTPVWHFTDAVAINHSGYTLKWNTVYNHGGYYNYRTSTGWKNTSINSNVSGSGVEAHFDFKKAYEAAGRVYMIFGNEKSVVNYGDFNVYARYGHKVLTIGGISVSLPLGGGITFSSFVSPSEQLELITRK